MRQGLYAIAEEVESSLVEINELEQLEKLRIKYLGKKGALTGVLRGMGKLPAEERPRMGKVANQVKARIESAIAARASALKEREKAKRLERERVDVTMPGTPPLVGTRHPLSLVQEEIEDIFLGLGYEIVEGPEVETDFYNFEALNVPKDHPARDMQDTFFLGRELVLRTQTSPLQVRTLEKTAPRVPVKFIAPGKVYRRDDDATHSPMFHQIEGVALDRRITFGDLKGTLAAFVHRMFSPETRTRFRPSYFPFTEPSAEVDISCVNCGGEGCRVCGHSGWLEILGSGMIHPRVLEISGYDAEKVTGFAFGMGIERIAMLKYGINDLRLFFDNDVRFLAQF